MALAGNVFYYLLPNGNNPVKEFLNSLPKPQKAKIFRIFQQIEQYGISSVVPHLKKLTGTPLWEIRILGKDNIRVIYVSLKENNILVIHGFIKKTQKTPERDLNLALKRYQDWIKRSAA